MSKSVATKRKVADSQPDSPAKKSKVSFAESKPTKKSKVAVATASSNQPKTNSPETPPKLKAARKAFNRMLNSDDPEVLKNSTKIIFGEDSPNKNTPKKSILKVKQDVPQVRAARALEELGSSNNPKVHKAAKKIIADAATELNIPVPKSLTDDEPDAAVTEPAPKVKKADEIDPTTESLADFRKPLTINNPGIPASAAARKAKPARKTAADFLSDDESTKPKVDKAIAKKKSKVVSTGDPKCVVEKPFATRNSDNHPTDASDRVKPKPTTKLTKEEKPAVDTVKDKSKVNKKSKPTNADDILASRQLRAENGEPVTPAQSLSQALKKAEEAEKVAEEKAAKIRKLLAVAEKAQAQQAAAEKAAKKASKMSKSDNNGTKMKSDKQDAGIKAESKRNKKMTNKNEDANDSDVDQSDEVSPEDESELLKGFDSDSPDDVQDNGVVIRETPPIVDPTGKIEQQLREAKNKAGPEDEPGAIYIGHIPHGFFEVQMRAFFSQFGDITRIRLSRNRRTGASKHFAFIEFASSEVAKIAAKTMDGYLMFGHILKSKFAPADSLHPDVWKGANKKFHKIPHAKLEGQKLAEPKSVEEWDKKVKKEEAKRKRKAKAMKEQMGYETPVGGVAEAKKVKTEK